MSDEPSYIVYGVCIFLTSVLGVWEFGAVPVTDAEANDFTDFILVHSNTIEELDMDYGEYDE